MAPVISVKNLSKQFVSRTQNGFIKGLFNREMKRVDAVKEISFAVQKGEAVAFLGPNGAGKTTTTKMLTGLIYPSAGTVQILGFTPFDRRPEFLRRVGLVMGNKSGLNWDLTAEQSFGLLASIYKLEPEKVAKRLARLTNLLQVESLVTTQVRRLSLGERMKMELIGAILHEPEVLFLDEPTIGLDITTKKNIRRFLRDIQKTSQTTLILTSHDMDDVEQVCDRVIVINHGKKVYDDSLQSLTNQYRQVRYLRLSFEQDIMPEVMAEYAEVVEGSGDSYLLRVPASEMVKTLTRVMSEQAVADIHIESIPLEEMIEELYLRQHIT